VDKLCSSHDPDSLPEQRNYARTYTRCLVGSRSIQHGSPPPPTVSLNAHSLPSSRAVGTNKWAPFLKVSRSGTDVLRPGSGRFFTVEMLHRRMTPSESKIYSRFTRVTLLCRLLWQYLPMISYRALVLPGSFPCVWRRSCIFLLESH